MARTVPVFAFSIGSEEPELVTTTRSKAIEWPILLYGDARGACLSENGRNFSHPFIDAADWPCSRCEPEPPNDPRDQAILDTVSRLGEPPRKGADWNTFHKEFLQTFGYNPDNPRWGYGLKTIQTRTRKLLKRHK